MIFIDTDLAIGFLSGHKNVITKRAKQILNSLFEEQQKVCLTVFNKAELIRGAYISTRVAQNLRIINEFLQRFEIISFDEKALRQYAMIYADLKKRGDNVGDFDELIASIVLSNEGVLYSHNIAHFQRIDLLQLFDWGKNT